MNKNKMFTEQELIEWLSSRKSKYGTPFSANTIKLYKNSVMNYTKGYLYKMGDINTLKEYLNGFSTSTALNKARAISASLEIIDPDDELKKKYKILIDDLIKLKATPDAKPNKNKKIDTSFTEWATISKRYKQIVKNIKKKKLKSKKIWTKSDKRDYMVYVLASLYYLIPPRRNVYSSMFIVNNTATLDPNKNYLVVGKTPNAPYTFVFANYKTVGKHGIKKIKVDKSVRLVLKSWIGHIKPEKGIEKPLLYNLRDNTQMTNHNLTNFISRNVFIGVGTQALRRLFDAQSHFVKAKDILVKNADAMNHSVSTAINTYIPDVK